jgi:hypothetical protein
MGLNPAQLSIGLRKHCARLRQPHLPLFGYGIAKTQHFDLRQSASGLIPELTNVTTRFRQEC